MAWVSFASPTSGVVAVMVQIILREVQLYRLGFLTCQDRRRDAAHRVMTPESKGTRFFRFSRNQLDGNLDMLPSMSLET